MNRTSPRKWPSSLEMNHTLLYKSLVSVRYYKALRTAEQRFTFYATLPTLWQRGFETNRGSDKAVATAVVRLQRLHRGFRVCGFPSAGPAPSETRLLCVLSFSNVGWNEPCWCSRHTKKGKMFSNQINIYFTSPFDMYFFHSFYIH